MSKNDFSFQRRIFPTAEDDYSIFLKKTSARCFVNSPESQLAGRITTKPQFFSMMWSESKLANKTWVLKTALLFVQIPYSAKLQTHAAFVKNINENISFSETNYNLRVTFLTRVLCLKMQQQEECRHRIIDLIKCRASYIKHLWIQIY